MDKDKTSKNQMPSKEDILAEMGERLSEAFNINQDWRDREVTDNYSLFEGIQWTRSAGDIQIANGMPTITINRTAPVIESICGFEIQNRQNVKYVPRLMNEEQEGYNDIMNDVVKYIEQNTSADIQYSQAFKDMLICGIGATDTSINYDNNPDGETVVERVFPAFVLWDSNARAKNLSDANWVARIKVVNKDAVKDQYGDLDYADSGITGLDADILQYYQSILTVADLSIVYEYQWRKKMPFYRVENPFKMLDISMLDPMMAEFIANAALEISAKFGFEPMEDDVFTIESTSEYNEYKEALESLNIKSEYTRQYKYRYYRALVINGNVVEHSENLSQKGFTIKFMTGQFSEIDQCFYGLVRSCKDPQRMLNQAVSDYVGYLQTSPKGGVEIEVDAVADVQAFVNTYTKAKQVTLYESGGLNKSRPKQSPPLPQGVTEMINYADSQIMSVCGVTPELMGMMQSKEMNSSFYRQQIQQGLTTLATYFDAKRTYMQAQGMLYTDCVRVMVDNAEGRLIKNVTGKGSAQYMRLTQNGVSAEYDVVLDEMPTSPDQHEATFQKLLEMQRELNSGANPVNIMPLVIQSAPFTQDVKDKLEAALQPPPPQEPDPLNQALLESEVLYKNAEAAYKQADAEKILVETQLKRSELNYSDQKQAVDIDYQQARVENEYSKTIKNASDVADQTLSNLIINQ